MEDVIKTFWCVFSVHSVVIRIGREWHTGIPLFLRKEAPVWFRVSAGVAWRPTSSPAAIPLPWTTNNISLMAKILQQITEIHSTLRSTTKWIPNFCPDRQLCIQNECLQRAAG